MPLHDFACRTCGHTFELLVFGAVLEPCPGCQGTDLARLLSRPAPAGKTAALVHAARAQAAREGHFSHYRPGERPRK